MEQWHQLFWDPHIDVACSLREMTYGENKMRENKALNTQLMLKPIALPLRQAHYDNNK